MKKILIVLLVLIFCLAPISVSAVGEPSVSAKSAVLIDAESGIILYGKGENLRRGMASTTKIMTALVVLEHMPLDTVIRVAPEACGVEGSSVYLYPEEELTTETLLYALMLQSANDAAEALAIAVAGSVEAFVVLMNEKAEAMGLLDTHFDNPHGLDGKTHYTTAYELAKITAAALQNETFREIVGTEKKAIPLHNGEATRLLVNHNRLLREYDDIIGVKTGYTRACGRTLVSAAEQNGVTLICVTLDDGDDWRDHRAMLDYGFAQYEERLLCEAGMLSLSLPVCGGEATSVLIQNTEAVTIRLPRTAGALSVRMEAPRFLYAGVSAGEIVGEAGFYLDGKKVVSVSLTAAESVLPIVKKTTWLEKLLSLFGF